MCHCDQGCKCSEEGKKPNLFVLAGKLQHDLMQYVEEKGDEVTEENIVTSLSCVSAFILLHTKHPRLCAKALELSISNILDDQEVSKDLDAESPYLKGK